MGSLIGLIFVLLWMAEVILARTLSTIPLPSKPLSAVILVARMISVKCVLLATFCDKLTNTIQPNLGDP